MFRVQFQKLLSNSRNQKPVLLREKGATAHEATMGIPLRELYPKPRDTFTLLLQPSSFLVLIRLFKQTTHMVRPQGLPTQVIVQSNDAVRELRGGDQL